jgi:hypothetical protein
MLLPSHAPYPCPMRGVHAPLGTPSPPSQGLHPRRWILAARPIDGGDSGPINGSRWISAANPGASDLRQSGLPMGHHYINPPSEMGSSFGQSVPRVEPCQIFARAPTGGMVLGGMTSALCLLKFHHVFPFLHCCFAAVRISLALRWGALPSYTLL